MISIHSEFISGAINSIYQALVLSKKYDIVAYSSSNQIFLYNPLEFKVFATLPTKSKSANSIKFIENFYSCHWVFGDSEGGVNIWQSDGKNILHES